MHLLVKSPMTNNCRFYEEVQDFHEVRYCSKWPYLISLHVYCYFRTLISQASDVTYVYFRVLYRDYFPLRLTLGYVYKIYKIPFLNIVWYLFTFHYLL